MLNYECKVETKSPIRRELTISVKADSIQEYIEAQFESLQKTAKIKGFRAGKVPLSILRQQYMADVKTDAFSKIIRDSYVKALEENKINAVGTPEIEPKSGSELKDGESLTFVARVEILPEIKLATFSKIKVARPSSETTDEDMKKSLDNLRASQSELVLLEGHNGPAKDGDFVEVTFTGTIDGQSNESLNGANRLVKIGTRSYLEDFENAIIGMKKGETKTYSLTFPKDYGDLAGKTAEFTVTVHEFKKEQLPELDDDFARRFKMESILELRKKVAEAVKADKERDARRVLRENLMNALVDAHEFEVPSHFVSSQLEYVVNETARALSSRGFTQKMVQEYVEKNREELQKRAERQVRVSLILDKVAEGQEFRIDSQDIEREYERIAADENVPLERVKEIFKNDSAQRQLRFRIKEERTTDYILGQVKVTDEKKS